MTDKEINPEDATTWLYYTNSKTRIQIDNLLEHLAKLESKKGIDSTPEEKASINIEMNVCLKEIKSLDKNFWLRCCPGLNEEILR